MPTITHTDYLAQVSGSGLVALPGLWVRLRNNSTGTDYFSTAVSDAQGAFTHSAVPGDYSAYTGTAATGTFAITITEAAAVVATNTVATVWSFGPYGNNESSRVLTLYDFSSGSVGKQLVQLMHG